MILKPIDKAPGYYVTNKGLVLSELGVKHLALSPSYNKQGYPQVNIRIDGQSTTHLVHRLVAEAHVPNPDNLPCVLHGDDDPANPDAENLRWGTHQDNVDDMISKGRARHRGPTTYKVLNVKTKEEYTFVGLAAIADELGIGRGLVHYSIRSKRPVLKKTFLVSYPEDES